MAAGYSDAALELGLKEMVNRSFWIELHTADPGNPVASTPPTRSNIGSGIAAGNNGYYGQHIAQGGVTIETTASSGSESRYSNSGDVDFGSATSSTDTNGWGEIGWISIWYDADDEDAADPGTANSSAFDTLFAVMQLQTAQTVGNGDPFVIRANTIDFISRNAA